MRVSSSDIAMASSRSFIEKDEKSASLDIWSGRAPTAPGGIPADDAAFSAEGLKRMRETRDNFEVYKKRQKDSIGMEGEDTALFIKKVLIEALTGNRIKTLDVSRLEKSADAGELNDMAPDKGIASEDGSGWGMAYTEREAHSEEEETVFSARGVIKTADGRESGFTLELRMERLSVSSRELTATAGDAKKVDPLVINFGAAAAGLTSVKFAFDLDSDGVKEDVSFAGSGSGFLSIDLNNDGVVNNGGELFGPATGNGMGELSSYDADGNSWIDEADPVFSRLRVWTKDPSGKDALAGLKESGVGAIYLGYGKTGFQVMDSKSRLHGVVNTTGIYLKDDGTPGTVQQIDLVA